MVARLATILKYTASRFTVDERSFYGAFWLHKGLCQRVR